MEPQQVDKFVLENYDQEEEVHLLQNDEERLLGIFPAEIWTQIFNSSTAISSPNHLTNLANSSPYFREVLKERRVVFFFPKVIDILSTRNETSTRRIFREINLESKLDEKEGSCEKWKDSILECRLVCSSWNSAIEQFYAKHNPLISGHEYHLNNVDLKSELSNFSTEWTRTDLKLPENSQGFLDKFKAIHCSGISIPAKNPFLGRSINFDFNSENVSNLETIYKIVGLFGHQVWYCRITIKEGVRFGDSGSQDMCYLTLRKCLLKMPNLKFLHIFDQSQITRHFSERAYRSRPLPKWKDLEHLELTFTGTPFQHEMIRMNSHVKYLDLFGGFEEITENYNLTLPNLKWLSTRASMIGDNLIERFGSQWKLSKLILSDCAFEYSKLFEVLRTNWAESLTDLTLINPFSKKLESRLVQSKNLRLNLPRLRKLSLYSGGSFFLDFALPLAKTLENLEITRYSEQEEQDRVQSEQVIELDGFDLKMMESNIWKIFGTLKYIRLTSLDIIKCCKNNGLIYSKEGDRFFIG